MRFFQFNPADYPVGSPLYVVDGYSTYTVQEYTVTKVTPKGQVVARRGDHEIRVSPNGSIHGSGQWSRRSVVGGERAQELLAEQRKRLRFDRIADFADEVRKAARGQDFSTIETQFVALAQAIEAQRAATVKQGAVEDESAVLEESAPKPYSETD